VLTDFHKFFTGRFLGKFEVSWLLKIPAFLGRCKLPQRGLGRNRKTRKVVDEFAPEKK